MTKDTRNLNSEILFYKRVIIFKIFEMFFLDIPPI